MTKKLIHTPRSRKDGENRSATVAEVREWIVAGSLAATQQMYTQLTQETERINAEYRMELEERLAKMEAEAYRTARTEIGHALGLPASTIKQWCDAGETAVQAHIFAAIRQAGAGAIGERYAYGEYRTAEDGTIVPVE